MFHLPFSATSEAGTALPSQNWTKQESALGNSAYKNRACIPVQTTRCGMEMDMMIQVKKGSRAERARDPCHLG